MTNLSRTMVFLIVLLSGILFADPEPLSSPNGWIRSAPVEFGPRYFAVLSPDGSRVRIICQPFTGPPKRFEYNRNSDTMKELEQHIGPVIFIDPTEGQFLISAPPSGVHYNNFQWVGKDVPQPFSIPFPFGSPLRMGEVNVDPASGITILTPSMMAERRRVFFSERAPEPWVYIVADRLIPLGNASGKAVLYKELHDKSSILFIGQDGSLEREIYLADDIRMAFGNWVPDLEKILFASLTTGGISLLSPETGMTECIYLPPAGSLASYPVYGSSTREIVFHEHYFGSRIIIIDLDGEVVDIIKDLPECDSAEDSEK